MRHVFLPTEHSESDLVLAGLLAELVESETLYVTWSPSGYQRPLIETILRPVAPAAPAPAEAPLAGLLSEIVGTMAAFVTALFAPRPAARQGDAS